VHIGQAGIQIGDNCWELYCLEHGISPTGNMIKTKQDDSCYSTFFAETLSGRLVPRSIMFDTEPTVIGNGS